MLGESSTGMFLTSTSTTTEANMKTGSVIILSGVTDACSISEYGLVVVFCLDSFQDLLLPNLTSDSALVHASLDSSLDPFACRDTFHRLGVLPGFIPELL